MEQWKPVLSSLSLLYQPMEGHQPTLIVGVLASIRLIQIPPQGRAQTHMCFHGDSKSHQLANKTKNQSVLLPLECFFFTFIKYQLRGCGDGSWPNVCCILTTHLKVDIVGFTCNCNVGVVGSDRHIRDSLASLFIWHSKSQVHWEALLPRPGMPKGGNSRERHSVLISTRANMWVHMSTYAWTLSPQTLITKINSVNAYELFLDSTWFWSKCLFIHYNHDVSIISAVSQPESWLEIPHGLSLSTLF